MTDVGRQVHMRIRVQNRVEGGDIHVVAVPLLRPSLIFGSFLGVQKSRRKDYACVEPGEGLDAEDFGDAARDAINGLPGVVGAYKWIGDEPVHDARVFRRKSKTDGRTRGRAPQVDSL